jgi:hypothetical protein
VKLTIIYRRARVQMDLRKKEAKAAKKERVAAKKERKRTGTKLTRGARGAAKPRGGTFTREVLRRLEEGSGKANIAGNRGGRRLWRWHQQIDDDPAIANVDRALQENFNEMRS